MAARRTILLCQLQETPSFIYDEVLFNEREYWTHPINASRAEFGEFHHLLKDLKEDPDRFHSYFRMYPSTFSVILNHLEHDLTKQDVGFRRPISAEERLSLTLRYLSTGMSYRSLAHSYRMGFSTVAKIIRETVTAIWSNLSPIYVKQPTKETYMEVAQKYLNVCNFPNVIDAIDGKHIRIDASAKSGSNYFNYKHYFSIVLQGVADTDLRFISVEIGAYGKESDGGTFSGSVLKSHLDTNIADLPSEAVLNDTNVRLPYFLLGDAAYPLKTYLMTPVNTYLTHDRRIYNYRHARARRCIECAFGVLARKWRVLRTAISTKVDVAAKIVLATVALHNAVIDIEGRTTNLNEIDPELWDDAPARDVEDVTYHGRPGQHAVWIREQLIQYFNHSGAVDWQENYI